LLALAGGVRSDVDVLAGRDRRQRGFAIVFLPGRIHLVAGKEHLMSKKFLMPAILALTVSAAAAADNQAGAAKKGASAGGERSDFALFDGTNAADPDAGVRCGARLQGNGNGAVAFTYHIAVSNFSNDVAYLRVTYGDGDLVRFAVPALSSFSLTQAAGGTFGVDDTIRVTSETAGALAGSVSVMLPAAAKPPQGQSSYCVTLQP
jgi:hypothetical protein